MPITPLPQDLASEVRDLQRRVALLENTNPLRHGAVDDSSGILRWQVGDLAAYTGPNGVTSPAQTGERALDASGNLLYDTVGLSSTGKLLGSQTNFSQGTTTGNGSYQTVSGSTVSFSLTRPTMILVLARGLVTDPTVGDTGFLLSTSILIDGAQSLGNGPEFFNLIGSGNSMTPFAVIPLMAGGSHSAALGVKQTNGKSWAATSCSLYVFQLGG